MIKFKIDIPPILAVIIAILSVQIGAAIAKGLFPALGATGTSSVRIGLSAIILLLVNRPNLRQISSIQWLHVIPYGLAMGAMNGIFYLALERIPLGLAVTLEFVGPLLLAVAGSKNKIEFLWVLLAAAGIALIAPWGSNGIDLLGAALALIAGFCWAGYIVLGKKTSAVMDGKLAVTTGMVFAALLNVPFGLTIGKLADFSTSMIIPGLALALLCSAIPFSLEMKALKQMPARTFSILMSLEPAVAAICGLIFLNELLTISEWFAVALVVIASTGATLSKRVSDYPNEQKIHNE